MGFVFHIFPGKRGKLRLQAQCITQIKALPEVSFGRVLQNSIDISLFQRAFRNFSAVSGVGCRSLRNLFAQNQCTGVAARKVQSAGFFVLAAQLFDGTARCGQFFLTGRAFHGEEAARKAWREQFDLASARAVAALPMLAEYCLPLVKVGGNFLAMKGSSGEEELAAARGAIKKLGGEYKETRTLHLPGGDTRTLILCKKISQTPTAYPRNGGKIAKSPLK